MTSTRRPFVIALDGPAASGKSTVGSGVAERLGFFYFDTGLLYRALTWVAMQRGVDLSDGEALGALVDKAQLEVLPPSVDDGRQVDVHGDGVDITWQVRSPEVDANVSQVSAHGAVRQALIAPQRAAICGPGTVMAGRDIGTVIVPEADLKVWLNASAEERARRRSCQTGEPYEAVLSAMVERDRFDGSREVAPMQKALDAVVVDTDGVPPADVVDRIVALAHERMRSHSSTR